MKAAAQAAYFGKRVLVVEKAPAPGGAAAGLGLRLLVTLDVEVAKHRALLTMLALRDQGVASIADLVDGLWGDDPPPTATKPSKAPAVAKSMASLNETSVGSTRTRS